MIKSNIAVIALARFSTSMYVTMVAPMLPFLVREMNLSITGASLLIATQTIALHMSQPLFGLLGDRIRSGYPLVWIGAVSTPIAIGLIGLAPSMLAVATLVIIGGLLTSMFRPQSYALVGQLSDHRSSVMGAFSSVGLLASAAAPIVVVAALSTWGLAGTLPIAIPGVVIGFLLYRTVQRLPPPVRADTHRRRFFPALRAGGRTFAVLFVIGTLHGWMIAALMTFLPLFFQEGGASDWIAGTSLTMFFAGGLVGLILGGHLADRLGVRWVVIAVHLAAIPAGIVFLVLTGPAALLWLALYGSLMFGADAAVIIAGQRLLPAHAGTATALLIGLAWGLGAMFTPLLGLLADGVGLRWTLFAVALLPSLSVAGGMLLPASLRATADTTTMSYPLE